MTTHYGPVCSCYRVWQSITPPPPCPAHPTEGALWSMPRWGMTQSCRGRHCAHSAECGTYRLINAGA